jgi:hypothetical protein
VRNDLELSTVVGRNDFKEVEKSVSSLFDKLKITSLLTSVTLPKLSIENAEKVPLTESVFSNTNCCARLPNEVAVRMSVMINSRRMVGITQKAFQLLVKGSECV